MDNTKPRTVSLKVNGVSHKFEIGENPYQVAHYHTLAQTVRKNLGLTGTKVGCDRGGCASCTVLLNGEPILSCLTLTIECDGCEITTIEGLQNPETGELDPLQQAFVDHTAFQCGFCTPGIIMASKSLLEGSKTPSVDDVREALAGHYCRCISHYHVLKAVASASERGR